MFDSAGKKRTRKPITVLVSFAMQCVAVGVMILIPLIYTEALPARQMLTILMAPPPPPRPVPAPDRVTAVHLEVRSVAAQRELTQPTSIPPHPVIIHDDLQPPIMTGIVADASSLANNAASNIVAGPIIVETPPPPPPPSTPERISGLIMAAKLIYQPKPVYPPLARQARIQGTVRLQAVISRDGAIENLTVVSGHPLLIRAALDAVQQWRYEPMMLNGAPVEVETTIEVNFVLGG
jgi:periplasmic protein TonB